ncbi:PKD domain-containing protein [Solirubrobacter soli]|uniref:PKD domain-containing protein n=1 Tax=Solirubrobacter soli TaxID=363832 RepID=UPI00040578C3|nr:PKD domain-containing protein [Solirubrobacter soli]
MRALRALVIAVLVTAALAPVASAADGVSVRFDSDPGRLFIDMGRLEQNNDVVSPNANFTLRRFGTNQDPRTVEGVSVFQFMKLIGMPPDQVKELRVANDSGTGDVVIDEDHISAFYTGDPQGPRRATFGTESGQGMEFIRPMASPTDENGLDYVRSRVATVRDPLDVSVETKGKNIRTVGLDVSDPKPPKDTEVVFTASVPQDLGGIAWTYNWDFGDGHTATTVGGPSVPHAYADNGFYQPSVTVIGDDGSTGVRVYEDGVQVGTPAPATPTPTPSPTPVASATPTPSATPTGRGRRGGGAGGNGKSGGGEGDKNDRSSGPSRSKGTGERRSEGGKQGDPSATATATPGASGSGSGSGDDGGDGSAAPAATAAPTGTAAATATPAPTVAAPSTGAKGEHVEGILLASSGTVADVIAAAQSSQPLAQERSRARRGGGAEASVAGWIGGTAGLICLLLLGAVREGGVRRR